MSSSTGTTIRRFFLAVVFVVGVALGWVTRGENDGNVAKTAARDAEEKTQAIEEARWEKQLRDLQMEKNNLLDKLAVASMKDVIIEKMKKEIDELKAKAAGDNKPAPPAEPAKTEEPKP